MINRQPKLHLQATKFQSNSFCRFNQFIYDEQYIVEEKLSVNRRPLGDKTNDKKQIKDKNEALKSSSQIVDLEDLWDAVQSEQKQHTKIQIQISILNMEPDEEICQFTLEQFESMATQQQNEGQKVQQLQKIDIKEQPEDLGDIWDQVQKTVQDKNKTIVVDCQLKDNNIQPKIIVVNNQIDKKKQLFDLNELLNSKNDKSLNFNLGKDYLIYDYHKFVVSIFQTNIHSYFGFRQSPLKSNTYYLYNLITKQNIIECFMDKCDQFLFTNTHSKNKADYERQYCMKFKLTSTNYHFATAFHKYINNGILYNLKPYNSYENQYEDSYALLQINDAFIGNNCYCNTNAFISQKYTNQPGQLKMNIAMKNGYLIANMGVNGVKSAPYNCRLQNFQSNFVYLLGLVDKENKQFIVRVGEGISPLIAFAISVGRKRYIESFTQ